MLVYTLLIADGILPSIPTHRAPTELAPIPNGRPSTNKAFTNFVFKISQPKDENSNLEKEIVPKAETTSVRLLKNCRYLMEYTPVERTDQLLPLGEKQTSWQMNESPVYKEEYLANVRLKLY